MSSENKLMILVIFVIILSFMLLYHYKYWINLSSQPPTGISEDLVNSISAY